ncbi:MAG: hypothetical protein IKL24_05145 [Clostridia bacterium]|nr:hypothetical protein [Clostridia bacterium]
MKKNKFFSSIHRLHLIPKLVCVMFAFIFWIYVMEVDSPEHTETFEGVSVTVVGASTIDNERNLSVFSGYDAMVDVTVKGQKSLIARYTKEDIIVMVDVSDVTTTGLFNLELHYDLPAGITFVESSVREIELFIDKKATRSIPVETDIKGYKIASGKYSLGDVTCDVEAVTVTGPEMRVNEIYKAVVEKDLEQMLLTETFETDGTIVLKNEFGENIESKYIKVSKTNAELNIPVYVKEYKPLRCESVHGLFDSKNFVIEPKSILIQGDPEIVNRIEYISLSKINEKEFMQDGTATETINIPDNVELVAGQPTHATVTVDLPNTFKTDYVEITEFDLINAGDREFTVINESLRITIVGDRAAVNYVVEYPECVTVTVDLTNFQDVSGEIKVPCIVSFDVDPGRGIVYEYNVNYDEYYVKLEAQ